ncbi:MAG: porin [Nitrosomonadales bacterium]|nr:porin [Nitrosomonadales bacterium]
MQTTCMQQKKLIVVALAAAAFATPALADTGNVSIYGKADMSYDIISNGTSAAGVAGASKSNVSSNVSKLGLKGSEGLGDGLTAVWQIEQQINMDNTGGTFATRNTFLGLKSDSMGTVLLGRHDTPYKLATRKLDVFGDTIADNRALMGGVTSNTTVDSAFAAFDGRQPDVIAYISPDMNGFTGAAAYVNLSEGNTTAAAAKSDALSLAGMYKASGFYGGLAYETHKLNSVLGTKESAWKLGLSYDIDAFTAAFVYEKSSDNAGALGANARGHNAYYLSGNYKMGMDAIKVAYGKSGQIGARANTGANQFSLGYDHGLSKRTKLYAIYSRINNQRGSDYGFSQSSAAAGTINGIGASPSVISLGMQHTF